MALISDDVAADLRKEFQNLRNPVRLLVFSQALADPESDQVRRLVEELAALDSRIHALSYDFSLDKDKVDAVGIARVPAIAVMGESRDYGVRMYGLPEGYEFGSLIDAILDVSRGESGLSEATKAALRTLEKPVHIQVFSTPTCPYCPRAVRLAYQFAIESDMVTADGIEVTGYPDLAREYRVSSVPKTVVGQRLEFEASPEGSAEQLERAPRRHAGVGREFEASPEGSAEQLERAPRRHAGVGREFEASPEGSAEQLERAPRRHAGLSREFIGAGPESMLLKHVQEAAGAVGPIA